MEGGGSTGKLIGPVRKDPGQASSTTMKSNVKDKIIRFLNRFKTAMEDNNELLRKVDQMPVQPEVVLAYEKPLACRK